MEKGKKALPISYVTGKRKSSKKLGLLDHSGTYYLINNCDEEKGVFEANLNAKGKRSFFSINCQENRTIRQSKAINYSKYTHMKSHSYKANFFICDRLFEGESLPGVQDK